MSVAHSVLPRSASMQPQQALVAIVYANEAYPQSTFERIVEECRRRGLRTAGVLQHPVCSDAAGHCDVALEELTTGMRTDLFEDRGPGAGGCRLNVAALAEVNGQVARSLDDYPELLILNKFGKVEAEGRGLLDLVAIAVDRGIPVVIGVPVRNLEGWRNFAGGMSVEFSSEPSEVADWLNRTFPIAVAKSGAGALLNKAEPSKRPCRGEMPRLLQTQTDPCLIPAEGDLVSVEQALATGLAEAQPIAETELVDLSAVTGRILAQTIKADAPLPRFDYSAMDGYAIKTSSLSADFPNGLKVAGSIAASRTIGNPVLRDGCAVRILTGAPIPAGADAVVAQEDVRREGDCIILSRAPRPGANIRRRGEDVATGDSLIEAGTAIGPLQAGVAAACGYPGVRVFRRLRVAIFTTGSELRQPGESIQPGEIYDANRFILRSLLAKPWIDIIDLGSFGDKLSKLRAVFQTAAAGADVILSAGGISVGDEDHVVDAFQRCGGKLWVHKVAIKPGKPLVLGKMADAIYIGLPGNPGALFTTFKIMIEPILSARAGIESNGDGERVAIANFNWSGRPGRTTYLPAVQRGDAHGVPLIELLADANSGKLHQLSRAAGFVIIAPETETIARGAAIRWWPLER